MAISAGIVGAAGFAGVELVRLVMRHPEFELKAITSNELEGKPLAEEYPGFAGCTDLVFLAHDDAALSACDVVFLAVPHTAALAIAPRLLEAGSTVIDLSADFRLKDPAVYERWYSTVHTEPRLLEKAAFGLPELFRSDLERVARDRAAGNPVLVGCAGCYPTATSLAAAPAVRGGLMRTDSIAVVDAVSGVTGAGKKPTSRTHFCLANENLEAYGVTTHRHTPEIEQILGLPDRVVFTPHLAPLNRGLLSTVTLPLASSMDASSVEKVYVDFYAESPFVTVLRRGTMPRTASVVGTNRAHIGIAVDERTSMLVAVCAIDNVCKGAAGQAVQCANIVFGMPESCGLEDVSVPVF